MATTPMANNTRHPDANPATSRGMFVALARICPAVGAAVGKAVGATVVGSGDGIGLGPSTHAVQMGRHSISPHCT